MVLWDAFKWAAPGVVLGLGTAFAIAPLFGIFLSGTNARDPIVFGATCCGYLCVCLVSTLVPAHRAAAVDPGEVLRSE